MHQSYAMINNYNDILATIENILNTKNLEFQTINNRLRIYFDNGNEIEIIINSVFEIKSYNNNKVIKKILNKESELFEMIKQL